MMPGLGPTYADCPTLGNRSRRQGCLIKRAALIRHAASQQLPISGVLRAGRDLTEGRVLCWVSPGRNTRSGQVDHMVSTCREASSERPGHSFRLPNGTRESRASGFVCWASEAVMVGSKPDMQRFGGTRTQLHSRSSVSSWSQTRSVSHGMPVCSQGCSHFQSRSGSQNMSNRRARRCLHQPPVLVLCFQCFSSRNASDNKIFMFPRQQAWAGESVDRHPFHQKAPTLLGARLGDTRKRPFTGVSKICAPSKAHSSTFSKLFMNCDFCFQDTFNAELFTFIHPSQPSQ